MKVIDQYLQEGFWLPMILGAAAIAAYKRFFSDAAKTCNQHYGDKKTECMLNYKIQISTAVLNDLMKRNAPEDQILRWRNKINKYKISLLKVRKEMSLQKRV